MEVNVTLFVCIFNSFSEIYIVFERGPRLAIITSSKIHNIMALASGDQRLPPQNKTQVTQKTKMVKKGI